MSKRKKKKVLLHICCGICAAGAAERLKQKGYMVTGYFYNPNIHPEQEYRKRLQVNRKVANYLDYKIIEGEYDKDIWFDAVKGLENEPEGGRRCLICYKIRLEKTCEFFKKGKFDFFTTTLTISPHKKSECINEIGEEIGGCRFLRENFKKKDGFKKTIQVSKKLNLYRQNYCGCVFSQRYRNDR